DLGCSSARWWESSLAPTRLSKLPTSIRSMRCGMSERLASVSRQVFNGVKGRDRHVCSAAVEKSGSDRVGFGVRSGIRRVNRKERIDLKGAKDLYPDHRLLDPQRFSSPLGRDELQSRLGFQRSKRISRRVTGRCHYSWR